MKSLQMYKCFAAAMLASASMAAGQEVQSSEPLQAPGSEACPDEDAALQQSEEQAQHDGKAREGNNGTKKPPLSKEVGGAVGGTAGQIAGAAVAGPLGAAAGGVIVGRIGEAIGSVFKKDKKADKKSKAVPADDQKSSANASTADAAVEECVGQVGQAE